MGDRPHHDPRRGTVGRARLATGLAMALVLLAVPASAGAASEPTVPEARTPPVPMIEPTGPERVVGRGSVGEDTWRIRRAPGPGDVTCWRIVVNGRTSPTVGTNSATGARCIAALPKDAPLAERVDAVAWTRTGTPVDITVLVAPSTATEVRFGAVGGRLSTVRGGSPFVAAGRRPTLWAEVRFRSGKRLICTAGSVTVRSDLRNPSITRASIGTPWGCEAP